MQSEFDVSKLKDGYFQAEGVDAVVEDGALVSVKEPRAHDLYANMKDLNARNCVAYDANAPIFGFVDYVGVSHADVLGVNYRIGDKIAGVYPSAGEGTRIRIPCLGDEFYLGNENFSGAVAVGKFAVPEAGKTTMKIADSKAAGRTSQGESETVHHLAQIQALFADVAFDGVGFTAAHCV